VDYVGYYFLEDRWLRNYVDVPTVTVSESTKQDLLGLGFKRVFVVPEGLNFEPLKEVSEKENFPAVAYVGRLKRAKRPDDALRAFKIVKERIPEAELWVIGDGPLKKDLEKMAGEGVRFFGGLNDVDRRGLVRRSWVLINPSVREGWGLNVVEADALGVPCVAYDVPGLRDSIQDHQTGLLVKSGDVRFLAEGLFTLLKHEELRWRLSENVLKYSRNFCWDKTAGEFMSIAKAVVYE
jgi:glycosyltransferase involved in cell wall biosynthesis